MGSFDPMPEERRMLLDLDDGHVHMHVAGAFLFEGGPLRTEGGGIDVERIRELVESQLYRVPRARQRIVSTPLGQPVWVDDASFNLQYHVRHTHLPLPGDERQLKRLCGHIASQELDREKPLWEVWVVEGLQGDRFAVVLKAHQCMTEGIWGMNLLEALLSETPEKEVAPAPMWIPRAAAGKRELLEDGLARVLRTPLLAARSLVRAARDPERTRERAEAAWRGVVEARPASETPLNRRLGPHRRFDWLVHDREELERVASAFDVPLTGVALACLAGAVGSFFAQRGIVEAVQRELELRVAVPESPGRFGAPDEGESVLAWHVLDLPISEPDPARRIARVRAGLAGGVRVSYEAFAAVGSWLLPGISGALARRQLDRRVSNFTLTPLLGTEGPRFLLGARLLEAYPLMPLVPLQALRVALLAHEGRVFWGFNSDWDLMPDLHDLVRATDAAFRELALAAD